MSAWGGWGRVGTILGVFHVIPLSFPSKVLTRRAELLSEATILQKQNSELGILLEEYLEPTPGR